MKRSLLKFIRRCGYDLHALPLRDLSLRDLDYDLPQLLGKDAPLIFDVGANKGQTIEKMLHIFPHCHIHAFEPDEDLAVRLRNIYKSNLIAIESLAFGSNPGQSRFTRYANDELNSFLELARDSSNPFAAVQAKSKIVVNVDTIDSYCRAKNIKAVDILKVDTQGFDLEVLRGAAVLLSSGAISVILVEVNFIRLYEGQCSAGQLMDWLGSKGYYLLNLYEQVRQNLSLSWATACFVRS